MTYFRGKFVSEQQNLSPQHDSRLAKLENIFHLNRYSLVQSGLLFFLSHDHTRDMLSYLRAD